MHESELHKIMMRDSLTARIIASTPVVYCRSILRAYMVGAKANSFPIKEYGLFGQKHAKTHFPKT